MKEPVNKLGHNGKLYAVFDNCGHREEYAKAYPERYKDCPIACFGQFDNAYRLDRPSQHRS